MLAVNINARLHSRPYLKNPYKFLMRSSEFSCRRKEGENKPRASHEAARKLSLRSCRFVLIRGSYPSAALIVRPVIDTKAKRLTVFPSKTGGQKLLWEHPDCRPRSFKGIFVY
jgi:hypothetical protein